MKRLFASLAIIIGQMSIGNIAQAAAHDKRMDFPTPSQVGAQLSQPLVGQAKGVTPQPLAPHLRPLQVPPVQDHTGPIIHPRRDQVARAAADRPPLNPVPVVGLREDLRPTNQPVVTASSSPFNAVPSPALIRKVP